ncbi:MAG: hypothetical protein QOG00_275 [Pyrinomonadaceae bacterium]|nr:hypothetical protein [Pyrinomonadaceae bacterium]
MKKIISLALLFALVSVLAPVTPVRAQKIKTVIRPLLPICTLEELPMPGADVGAKINACDRLLGAVPGGEIHAWQGGEITSVVKLSRGRTLHFHKATYTLRHAADGLDAELGMVRYNDGVTIKGDGWGTVIIEPQTTNSPTVFAPLISSIITEGGYFHGVTRNVTIRDLQIKGRQTVASNGTYSTIEIGNSHDMLVENVFLNQTTGNGITAGGSSLSFSFDGCGGGKIERECAAGVRMIGNRLFQVQNQGLNVVNGREVLIANNVVKDHNRLPGSNGAGVDVETNTVTDTAQLIRIEQNLFDFSNSPQPSAGNGINIQSSGQGDEYGPVYVERNILIGGALAPDVAGHMVFGIFVSAGTRRVTVAGNKIQRTSNSGIIVYGSGHTVQENELVSVGDRAGNVAVALVGTQRIGVSRNKVKIDTGAQTASDLIAESAGANFNLIEGNTSNSPPVLVGASSRSEGHKRWPE